MLQWCILVTRVKPLQIWVTWMLCIFGILKLNGYALICLRVYLMEEMIMVRSDSSSDGWSNGIQLRLCRVRTWYCKCMHRHAIAWYCAGREEGRVGRQGRACSWCCRQADSCHRADETKPWWESSRYQSSPATNWGSLETASCVPCFIILWSLIFFPGNLEIDMCIFSTPSLLS